MNLKSAVKQPIFFISSYMYKCVIRGRLTTPLPLLVAFNLVVRRILYFFLIFVLNSSLTPLLITNHLITKGLPSRGKWHLPSTDRILSTSLHKS
jgi:hypothetical protein